jgi:hypothetical protein
MMSAYKYIPEAKNALKTGQTHSFLLLLKYLIPMYLAFSASKQGSPSRPENASLTLNVLHGMFLFLGC